MTKQLLNQRDKEIYDLIFIYLDKGYSIPVIYEKLTFLTGLSTDSLKKIRFRVQKERSKLEKVEN